MRRAGAGRRVLDCLFRRVGESHGHGSQPHNGAVAGCAPGGRTEVPGFEFRRPSGATVSLQRGPGGAADVEAVPRAAQVALIVPSEVALQLVQWIESTTFDQALGQTERHGGVVRPLPGLETEGAATDQVRQGLERPR